MRIDKLILNQVGPFDHALIPFPVGKNPDLADTYLLTGPNGAGKSTVLYAIAGAIGCGQLGQDHGGKRLRSAGAVAAFASGSVCGAAAWRRAGADKIGQLLNPFGGDSLPLAGESGWIGYFRTRAEHPILSFYQTAQNFRMTMPFEARPKFSWAAFAYAGMRSVSDAKITAIQEPTTSPFENCLSFVQSTDTNRLAQWIANQDFKRLKAKEAGKLDRANQLGQSVRDIERVIAQIIGEDFAFITGDVDNDVRVRRNKVIVDLGLLPDGLKSIVSWIADLLMRLDRIPWVDDTPPMKRSFLLLLDEVDIHLHPSWQRKVLPIVQRMFPNAQIIASTHSPFVVASAEDAWIVTLKVDNGVATVAQVAGSQAGVSYSAILRSIFGIDSEFDLETEQAFQSFHQAKQELLTGATNDRTTVTKIADQLAARGEEVQELVAIELRQLDRQLATRGVP